MANPATRKRGAQRLDAGLKAVDADLKKYITTPLSKTGKPEVSGVLRGLRALGSTTISAARRRKLRANLFVAVAKVIKEAKIDAQKVGAASLDALAKRFVQMVERVGYERYGITELRRKARGLRGVFAGELFEQLVLNMRTLQDDLRGLALMQLQDIARFMKAEKQFPSKKGQARLINALGDNIEPRDLVGMKFTKVVRATDIVTFMKGEKKFIDFAYIAYSEHADGRKLVTFLVEAEIKLPRAARAFSKQIGKSQGRYAFADTIEMTVPHEKRRVSFTPDQVMFDRGSINRVAVTMTRASDSTYRIRFTRKGGYPEVYTRVGLALDVRELRKLVRVLFLQ